MAVMLRDFKPSHSLIELCALIRVFSGICFSTSEVTT